MSILPDKAQGSTSSSSSSPSSANPTPSNHGTFFSSSLQSQSQSPSRQFHAFGSLQIAHSHSQSPPNDMSPESSGPFVSGTRDSGGLSKEVTELGRNVDNNLSHQMPNVHSQSRSGGRGAGSAQGRGKFSGTTVSPRSQQVSGHVNSHGSSASSGGRKAQVTSGNHLLNFHYDPISRSQPRAPPPRRHHKIKPYNKDLFLQANYKFVVLDSGNYTPESMDPDKMLRWEDIICLRYSTSSTVQCPICLESPLCPQITSCGHIFCFPCILQYLLMGKEDAKGDCWKRCPLCFVMISPKDLYTLVIENVNEYRVGDKVELLLLTRQKDSSMLSHKNKQEKDINVGSPEETYDPFSKFTFTSDVDLSVRKAISDLDGWLVRADAGLVDDLEKLPYVCAAMEHLEQRQKYWDEHRASDNVKSSEFGRNTGSYVTQPVADATQNNSDLVVSDTLSTEVSDKNKNFDNIGEVCLDAQICSDHPADASESLGPQEVVLSSSYDESNDRNSKVFGDVKEKDSYNFYQAADGQHIILHPINMKCLLHHFGSADLLPDRISGKILQLETVTQSEAIRRRFRFLSHFSLTTTFQLCEIDLSELLPPDSMLPFIEEIKKRAKQRKQVARKERKEKIKAEAAVEGPMPIFSSFVQSSRDESPIFSMDDFEALGTSPVASSSTSVVGERRLFSNVTKLGFAAGHDSPSLKIEEISSQLENLATTESSSAGSRNTGVLSFANVISRDKAVNSLEAPKMNELGKKGKKPSRVLLSTAGGRRY
ncbi:hypothetical protein G4B88_027286 [Cannabis sativa]|uniref:RING-type domain-containing protein n=1 Tax=Cannabis sativa TaxID=3483 RepID=A0A7J6HQJ8_CANSA|nr:hypothetical protein G4B88_027286 [Cannabis sativa]